MGKLVVVEHDAVTGTDKHNVTGTGPNPGTPPPPSLTYTGMGDFTYTGSMTDDLSTFVRIAERPVAVVTSGSTLDPGEAASGGHAGPNGSAFVASGPAPLPTASTLSITDSPLGGGKPNGGAGSALLTVDGVKALLDHDSIDTCSGVGAPNGSTVAAGGQDFVTCSE